MLGALPAGPHYAVLDGARDRRIRGFVLDSRAPRWNLYRGKLTRELEDAAPYLLSLEPGKPYVEELFARFWGRSCGILVASAQAPALLRRHLRKFLLARDPKGRVLVFRYYDPRMLRVYLPSLTPDELGKFFGETAALACEGDEPGTLQVYRRLPEGLDQQLVRTD